ncbi:MAG: hypothetical protein AB8E15_02405 [Bdellovibrionales bacterium]
MNMMIPHDLPAEQNPNHGSCATEFPDPFHCGGANGYDDLPLTDFLFGSGGI